MEVTYIQDEPLLYCFVMNGVDNTTAGPAPPGNPEE